MIIRVYVCGIPIRCYAADWSFMYEQDVVGDFCPI